MKSIFLGLIILITLTSSVYGQEGNVNISYKDSIELIKTWKKFKEELFAKDVYNLKLLSRKEVIGEYLFEPINSNYKPYILIDTLLKHFFQQQFSGLSPIILKNNYKIVVYSSLKDKKEKEKGLTQYQIWFTRYSEPGFQFAFIFERIKGKFKFYGLTSVP